MRTQHWQQTKEVQVWQCAGGALPLQHENQVRSDLTWIAPVDPSDIAGSVVGRNNAVISVRTSHQS